MLSIYPWQVLERAISPVRGLAAYVAYPNLAKFKEFLDEWHAEYVADLRRHGLLKQQRSDSLRLCPPPDRDRPQVQGDLANVHIYDSHPQYPALVEWSKTANLRLWKFGKSSDGREGIWIPLNVWQDGQPSASAGPRAEKQSFALSDAAIKVMREADENRAAARGAAE